jgi:hypothetical protein
VFRLNLHFFYLLAKYNEGALLKKYETWTKYVGRMYNFLILMLTSVRKSAKLQDKWKYEMEQTT